MEQFATDQITQANMLQALRCLNDVVADNRKSIQVLQHEIASRDEKLLERLVSLQTTVQEGFQEMSGKFDSVEGELKTVNVKLDSLDNRLININNRLESIDNRLITVEVRLESIDNRLVNTEKRLESLESTVHIGFTQTNTLLLNIHETLKDIKNK